MRDRYYDYFGSIIPGKVQEAIDSRLVRHELGFLQLAEPPSPGELAEYYSKSYYQEQKGSYRHSYTDLENDERTLRLNRLVDKAISMRLDKKPLKVLDIGCGEGFVLREFVKRGWNASGIDFSVVAVETMNPDLAGITRHGDIYELIEEYRMEGEIFDLMWLDHVLEHVIDPVELLGQLRGIMNGSSVLVASVPNDGNHFHEMLLESGRIGHRWWIASPDHISYFTPRSLRALAEATGFSVKSVEGSFPIDWFLAHPGSNFVRDSSNGPGAHNARLLIDFEIHSQTRDRAAVDRFYEALAELEFGRDIVAFLMLSDSRADDTGARRN